MTGIYNRSDFAPRTMATAEQVNSELTKIQLAFEGLNNLIAAIQSGSPVPSYTWRAYADDVTGTSNFTTGEPGTRAYIGLAFNKLTPEPSQFAEDYTWSRIRAENIVGQDGVDGIDGIDGKWIEFVWRRAAAQPATPTGNGIPFGWSDEPPIGSDPLWMSRAKQEIDGTLVEGQSWSEPIRHDGPPGENGVDGIDGTDGLWVEFVWQRSASQPETPTGNGIPSGWDDEPPVGSLPLWMSRSKQQLDGSIVEAWSTPVRHDGANAITITLMSDRQVIHYGADGFPSTTQTTTFAVNKQNTTATVSWSITDANGIARTPVTSYLSASTGNSVTMTEAQFAVARNSTSGVIVTASLTDGEMTVTDKISIVRVQAGATGATGAKGDTGATGAKGDTGSTGAQGAPAIGFVQDTNPGNGQFTSQTWYRPTSKEWYRWTGSAWSRILGDLSAQDLISDSAYLGDAVVISAKIADLAVGTSKIANSAITNAKIGNAAITNAKIGNLQVDSAKIADLTVGTEKIALSSITQITRYDGVVDYSTGYTFITNGGVGVVAWIPISASVAFVKSRDDSDLLIMVEWDLKSTNDILTRTAISITSGVVSYPSPAVVMVSTDADTPANQPETRTYRISGASSGSQSIYFFASRYVGVSGYPNYYNGNMYAKISAVTVIEYKR